MDQQK